MTTRSLFDADPQPAAPITRVAHFRDVRRHWHPDTQTWDAGYVYIGRANRANNLPASRWGNPFPMEDETPAERQRVIAEYRAWLDAKLRDPVEQAALRELNGLTLVCWCKNPHKEVACHGDVLVEALRTTQPTLRIVSRDVVFPATWRDESKRWAERRKFAQAQVDAIESDLIRFRAIRDSYRTTIQENAA